MLDSEKLQKLLSGAGITFLERGWLSSNNILIRGDGPTALVDSGYCAHAQQTQQLLMHALKGGPLDRLLNTHLHSDHCGGNAILQHTYPLLETYIPPGQAQAVKNWDPVALTYEPTGQECPPFQYQELLEPGTSIQLGTHHWEVHGAKGHDPHSVVLFQPEHRILISADSLWENGFGVVFPELEGKQAFAEVAETLDRIEKLTPEVVIPGHGIIFQDVQPALQRARTRLAQFVNAPEKHTRYAIKVLIKYRLLEWQSISIATLMEWANKTAYLRDQMPNKSPGAAIQWMTSVLNELQTSGALRIEDQTIVNV